VLDVEGWAERHTALILCWHSFLEHNTEHELHHCLPREQRSLQERSGVARICCEVGQSWKLCHGALRYGGLQGRVQQLISFFMTNSFVTNEVLIERAVSC